MIYLKKVMIPLMSDSLFCFYLTHSKVSVISDVNIATERLDEIVGV